MGNKSKFRAVNTHHGIEIKGQRWEARRNMVAAAQPRACNGSTWRGVAPEAITHTRKLVHRSGQLDKHGRGSTLIGHAAQERHEARMLSVVPRIAP